MAKKHTEEPARPHGHRDRGVTTEQLSKKPSTQPDAKRSHDPEAADYEADARFEPDREGSRS